jgi:hypothetical protein
VSLAVEVTVPVELVVPFKATVFLAHAWVASLEAVPGCSTRLAGYANHQNDRECGNRD